MDVAASARACTLCAEHLPRGPRPTFVVSATARLLIVGQAPGTRVHETGVPWNDRSGDRLREWLAMDRATFYDAARIAVLPVGLCYPGRLPRGGDAPPRPECAPRWHAALRATMPALRLTLLVGHHAQRLYLGPGLMTARVARQPADTALLCLPHPSWRTTFWLQRNPWFAAVTVPALRVAVARAFEPCEAAA